MVFQYTATHSGTEAPVPIQSQRVGWGADPAEYSDNYMPETAASDEG